MSSPTPETDLILARYIGQLTPEGWSDFVEGSDARIVQFLTDLRQGGEDAVQEHGDASAGDRQ